MNQSVVDKVLKAYFEDEKPKEPTQREKRITHVAEVRARTFCEQCGAQPIEWHNFEHRKQPHRRISRMVNSGCSLAELDEEIAKCEALCKTCHGKRHTK